jgi:hypothetical protein
VSDNDHIQIANCGVKAHPKASTELKLIRLKFICNMTWEKLQLTDDSAVRHCSKCNHSVTFCSTLERAEQLVREGACIAIPPQLSSQRRERSDVSAIVGSPTAREVTAGELENWGRRVFAKRP